MSENPDGAGLRVCIVKLGAIGDVVNSLPFVNRLRDGWPRAHISWCIAPLAHSLVAGHPAVDEFLVLDLHRITRWPGYVRQLRRSRFDLVVDLQRIAKSALIARCTGAPRRLGFDRARSKEWSWVLMTECIAPREATGVTVEQYLEFADYLGLPPSEARWDLPQRPFERGPDCRPMVVINPGASKEANRWAPDRWAELCRRLIASHQARIVIAGGPEDRGLARQLRELAGVPLEDSCGHLSLVESAGLFAAADLFVGGDTGPLHMAVAVGTPTVALFGAADPGRTGPYGQGHGVIRQELPCAPCRKRRCPLAGHPCMSGLEVGRVHAKVSARLDELCSRREGEPTEFVTNSITPPPGP